MKKEWSVKDFHPFAFIPHPLLGFLVPSVLAAATAKLLEFKPFSRCLFVFRRRVIATLTITTLENNIIARHNLPHKTVFGL
jgi:hypothetical protein